MLNSASQVVQNQQRQTWSNPVKPIRVATACRHRDRNLAASNSVKPSVLECRSPCQADYEADARLWSRPIRISDFGFLSVFGLRSSDFSTVKLSQSQSRLVKVKKIFLKHTCVRPFGQCPSRGSHRSGCKVDVRLVHAAHIHVHSLIHQLIIGRVPLGGRLGSLTYHSGRPGFGSIPIGPSQTKSNLVGLLVALGDKLTPTGKPVPSLSIVL